MSMRVISWEEYIGTRDQGLGTRDRCSDNNIAPELHPNCSNRAPCSPVPIPYSSFLIPNSSFSLAVTIGVFDGVHLGHQSLIRRICEPLAAPPSPVPCSLVPIPYSPIPTVVTFKQNPLRVLKPDAFAGDIISLEQKLSFLETLGVQLAVLIDFSEEFSKINGRDFIDLLLGSQPVKLIALGQNFRCGHQLDTGAEEIRSLAGARGVETWAAPSVMDGGKPVSSNRIRLALAAGCFEEAQRMLGRPLDSITLDNFVPK